MVEGSRCQRVAVVAYPGCAEAPWGGGVHAAFSTRIGPLLFWWTPPSPETLLPRERKSEQGACHPESTFCEAKAKLSLANIFPGIGSTDPIL